MLFNRHHIRAFWQALLVLLAFASCINDDFADDTTCVDSDDTPWYLGLQLQFDASELSTRATGDTNDPEGTHGEHEIGEVGNYAILFDDKENLFGVYPLTMSLPDVGHNDYESDVTKEGDYLRLLHVYRRKNKLPESCLVVLNASDELCKKLEEYDRKRFEAKLSDVLEEVWKDNNNPKNIGFADSEHKYFTMTNSIYLDDTEKKDVVSIKNKIYPTIQEALQNRTKVYVERMVAKFSITNEHKNEHTDKYQEDDKTDPDLVFYPAIDHGLDPLIFFEGLSEDGKIIYVATHNWRIRVTGWGINALETQNNLFKKIQTDGGYFNDWYAEEYFRSYWSEDPHYGDKDKDGKPLIYPWQYRDAVDRESVNGFHYYNNTSYFKFKDPGYSSLKNYSYGYFVNQTYPKKEDSEGIKIIDNFNRVVYAPENTYGDLTQNLDSRINLLAGTHLIVCAQLEVDLNDNGKYVVQDWYRDRSGIFYKSERDCFVSFAHSLNQLLRSQESMKYPLYDWIHRGYKFGKTKKDWIAKPNRGDDVEKRGMKYMLYYDSEVLPDTYLTDTYLAKLVDDKEKPEGYMTPEQFTERFGQMKAANILYGDGKLLPWFEDNANKLLLTIKTCSVNENGEFVDRGSDDLYIYEKDDDSKQASNGLVAEIVPGKKRSAEYDGPNATDDDIKSLLYDWVGPVDHFNQGKMYYAAPVLHNGANKPEKDRSQKTLGDYGVVRNNWYQFNLKDIINIGTPVSAPDEPIVPNNVNIDDVINFTVKIIGWHSFQWDVPVLE